MRGVQYVSLPADTTVAPPSVHTVAVLTEAWLQTLININTLGAVDPLKSSRTAPIDSISFVRGTEDTLVDAPGQSNPSAAGVLTPESWER